MATVRKDKEFSDRGSDFEFSGEDIAYYKEKYDRIGKGSRGRNVRGRVRDTRNRTGVRQNDVNGREVTNGYRSRSRSVSGSGGGVSSDGGGACCVPRRCSSTVRTTDRELGELSSDSGSGDAVDLEAQLNKGCEVMNVVENGAQAPVEKKRKFSPIVWDRDDVSSLSKTVNYHAVSALPPPPPLAEVSCQLKNFIPDGRDVETSPVDNDNNHNLLSSSPDKSTVVLEPVEDSASKSKVFSQHEEVGRDNGRKAEQKGDEYYLPRQNISRSRWASWENSLAHESEIMEYPEMFRNRKRTSHSLSSDSPQNTLLTPATDDIEVADPARSLGEDDCPDDLSAKDDNVEVDDVNKDDHSCSNSENGHNSHKTLEPAVPPQSINMLQGCRSVNDFERLNKINEGTYGVVYRARDRKTGEIVALKKVKMEKEREGFPLTSLREMNILLSFDHPSIVDVKEVVVGSGLDCIFMVMEYMEHDLKGLMELIKQPFSQSEVKCLMLQLLEGVKYLHDNWVLHRDLKTSNVLLNNQGELKICDFGLARQYGIPLKPYTHLVVTLWYRAPELLLGAKQYSTAIDMWSLGCIMAELLSKAPLFNGKTEFDQIDKIFRTLGTPSETIWPGFSKLPGVKVNFVKHQYNLLRKKFPATSFSGSPVLSDAGFDLLSRLLTYDPEKRITAEDALNHKWFSQVPLPKSKDFMPTFPAQHAQDKRLRRTMKSPDPLQKGKSGTGGVFA